MNFVQRVISWLTERCGAVLEWAIDHLGSVPTTNLRIVCSIGAFILIVLVWLALAIAHSIWPWIGAWTPEWDMLLFVTAWAGLDVLQFSVKRNTHTVGGPQDEPPPPVPAT